MGIYNFPANFVYWEHLENHQEIKKLFLNEIEHLRRKFEFNENGIVNGSTSYENGDINNDDTTIVNFLKKTNTVNSNLVWKPIDNAIREINLGRIQNPIMLKHSFIHSAWFTEYKKNGTFNYHTHLGHGLALNDRQYIPSFSLVYILHDENEDNATTFMNPSSMYVSTEQTFQHDFHTGQIPEIKEGTVLVFPSSLYHCVQPVEKPGRITIAINIFSSHG